MLRPKVRRVAPARRAQAPSIIIRTPSGPTPPTPSDHTCFLLEMPVDIVFLITARLGLADQFRLSHTCRALWRIAGKDWSAVFDRLPRHDRKSFIVDLAHTSPDFWICSECEGAHRLHPSDTPSNPPPFEGYPDQFRTCSDDTEEVSASWDYYRERKYEFKQRHAQLALKLCRLPGLEPRHKKYLREIMKPHRSQRLLPGPLTIQEEYRVQARIINRRFYLYQEWVFSHAPNTGDYSPALIRRALWDYCDCASWLFPQIHLCFHGDTNGGDIHSPAPVTSAHDILESVLESESEKCRAFACTFCLTDCEFLATNSSAPFTMRVWKDFGPGESPWDPVWMAHCRSSVIDITFIRRRGGGVQKKWSQWSERLRRSKTPVKRKAPILRVGRSRPRRRHGKARA